MAGNASGRGQRDAFYLYVWPTEKQYLVIACGGEKKGAKSGGTYVAFALPDAAGK